MGAIEMPGLALGPMGAWLSAVGALRMLSRTDPAAALHWDGTVPVLTTARPAPERDLADRAAFTPVITPWQSGGGWGPKDKTSAGRLAALRESRSPRLDAMRRSITAADAVLQRHPGAGKDDLVRLLRGALPDEAVPWLDAAVPLRPARDGVQRVAVAWAPMAGTGGNDGRWDVSTACHAAVLGLDPDREPGPSGATDDPSVLRRRAWLDDLLDGTAAEPLPEMSPGMYWPQGAEAGLANPWAVILAAEGLCAFGDAPVAEFAAPGMPWTAAAGPETDREHNRGEAWLPLWAGPMTMPEVALLLGGPQPRWRGAGARTPAQMYSSLASGGWPAGVTGYARYALARRRGQAHVAAPLDIVLPEAAPAPEPLGITGLAAAAGIAESTLRGYVARGQAPLPDFRDLRTGAPGWLPSTAEAWLAARPGRGARTDLDDASGQAG